MAITYGFYNSVNHDRVYNANQMSQIFDGIINDGVYESIGDKFAVTPAGGFVVNVGSGRAWFNHTWTYNDGNAPLSIADPDLAYGRKDLIVIDVNYADSVRANSIIVLTGSPDPNPSDPGLINEPGHVQYPIARITVPKYSAGFTDITAAMITQLVGTSACPYVTGILRVTSIDNLYTQWEAQFEEWFEHLQNELDDNQAAHLQHEIDELNSRKQTKGTWNIITIRAANWLSGGTYSLENDYPSNKYDILDLMPFQNTTDAQLKAWKKAQCGGFWPSGQFGARGEIPTIDIPLAICYVEK